MIDTLLQNLAPHYCYGCGQISGVLCANCKYDIISEPFSGCLACGRLASRHGLCSRCRVPYQKAWCSAERIGATERLIDAYKFQYVRAAHEALGDLLLGVLDELPSDTIVVPIPTVAQHIRQRGYDHTLLLARYVAQRRHIAMRTPLLRAHNSVQRHADRKQRILQAKTAFKVDRRVIETDRPHLLIDDVVTTGATIHYAAQALRDAGVRHVWVGAVARQPLD
jgi:ComF family protein